jgi:nitroreductase
MKVNKTDYAVLTEIKNRWSPRSFASKQVASNILYTILEAGRLAPSASNEQPWRFIVATEPSSLDKLASCLNESNQVWAKHAPVLLAFLAKKTNSKGKDNAYHRFDTGAAWAFMALEATHQGLYMHAMGGFNAEKLRQSYQIDDDFDVLMVAALGYLGESNQLSQDLQVREQPKDRKELRELIVEMK